MMSDAAPLSAGLSDRNRTFEKSSEFLRAFGFSGSVFNSENLEGSTPLVFCGSWIETGKLVCSSAHAIGDGFKLTSPFLDP